MRKAMYTLFALVCATMSVSASPGDTTWIQANKVQLNYYNDFDTAIVFPTGSTSYRKIYMIFTLGKYVCPGSPQYCGDWDYTVQNFWMPANGSDTLELGRLITPYAHTGSGPFTATWTRRYIYDVTDYYPALKNAGKVRIHYSGYSGGFTADIKFAFIEGTPERNVLKVEKLWSGDYNYGHGATPINTALGTRSLIAPAGTLGAEVKMNITGHGGDDRNCAEFCPNVYNLALNGNQLVQQPFFRDDCSGNDLYPQSGTWIYARAGWCPGAPVNTFSHRLTGLAAGSYTVGMNFPSYTSTGSSKASYTIAGSVIYYGATNKTLDASLEDIIAPTDAEYHWRSNPESMNPRFTVRNTGSTAITSIRFEYGVVGLLTNTYTWTGTLPSLQSTDISLPALGQLRLAPGTHGFIAKIMQVNGSTDADVLNNTLSSTFTSATEWPSEFQIQFRTTEGLSTNSAITQTSWKIFDRNGSIVKQKTDCATGATCDDTVRLQPGAYTLVVSDSAYLGFYDVPTAGAVAVFTSNGLSFVSGPTGFFRVYDLTNGGLPMTLPGYYGGNFGSGFSQSFIVGSPLDVKGVSGSRQPTLLVYPNPASKSVTVIVEGLTKSAGTMSVSDMLGRILLRQEYKSTVNNIDVSGLGSGMYLVAYDDANGRSRLQQPFVIAR